jgi:seryl-tRNA synthetase
LRKNYFVLINKQKYNYLPLLRRFIILKTIFTKEKEMIDLKLLRTNPQAIIDNLKKRNDKFDLTSLIQLDETRRKLEHELSQLNAQKNILSPQIGELLKKGADASAIKTEVLTVNQRIKEIDPLLAELQADLLNKASFIPNMCSDKAPLGAEKDNKVVREWGTKRVFTFPIKDHKQLGLQAKIMEDERAVKVSGSGFVSMRAEGAILERALLNYFLDTHTRVNGFTEICPPVLVKSESMYGTGQLPKFKDQSYFVAEDDMYIIPTAEVPITNLHRDEQFTDKDLPINYVGYTPCFRREAGSYGTGVKGFLRTHQFNKVEMVKFCLPEESEKELDNLVSYATKILENLEIPYRVLDLATGDMGFGASRCFDLEVWSPGENKYLEASSCSNFLDFQARRMNIRFKRGGDKPEFVHTLNGSGLATSRLMVALLENNQNEDGSINIPKVLQSYTGFDKIYVNKK